MAFNYKNNKLYCENAAVEKLAKKYGTPLYIYSYAELKKNFEAYKKALKGLNSLVCYALKTNSNIAFAAELAKLGAGVDIVSQGELFRSLKAGFDSSKIVYAGVGKTDVEIEYALRKNILMFNVESVSELERINKIAKKLKKKARICFRVNPDVDPKTHPYVATGLAESKFGIDIKHAKKTYVMTKKMSNIEPVGVHMHIGSQLLLVSPFEQAVKKLVALIRDLRTEDINLKYLDIGGGLGISYKNEKVPTPSQLISRIKKYIKGEDITLVLEPGRSISGTAGILVAKVIYNKQSSKKEFVIVDAAMNDLARPALYNAYHEIVPVQKVRRNIKVSDVVGPVCESGDFLAKNRKIPHIEEGEYLALKNAGAYAFSMSSNYNSRTRA
ncbi:diaminopimelate decarboxylase, partial [bacterium]